MREDEIRLATTNLSGQHFEPFVVQLLRRTIYPGLVPTSATADLGEDARTMLSTAFLHDGHYISVAISKTATLAKIRSDCETCRKTGRNIDRMVFVTGGFPVPTESTQGAWQDAIVDEFGWDLEVLTLNWIVQTASQPDFEGLVDDYLHIPPPGGDYIPDIKRAFERETQFTLGRIRTTISGIPNSIQRSEINIIEDQLDLERPVLLTGDAGTGKSGIASKLARDALDRGWVALLIDARRFASLTNIGLLGGTLGLKGQADLAVARIGGHSGCRVIIDQLDNVFGTAAVQALVEFGIACANYKGVEVIVISRGAAERDEGRILGDLTAANFAEIQSRPLSEEFVQAVFRELGIEDSILDLIALGTNLLNLQIIADIKSSVPEFNFSQVLDQIELWEEYLRILTAREGKGAEIIAAAVQFSREGLNSPTRTFNIGFPPSSYAQRLESWGIIIQDSGRNYRFQHENFQDFLYAWDATENRWMPRDVQGNIQEHHLRRVLEWMQRRYARTNGAEYAQFLREVLLND